MKLNPLSFVFLLKYSLLILKKLTFAPVNELAMTYQPIVAQQRNLVSFSFFSALYLVVSDVLPTHTLLAFNKIFSYLFMVYASAKRGVRLANKGLLGVSFVRVFVLFYNPENEAYIFAPFQNQKRARFKRLYVSELHKNLHTCPTNLTHKKQKS